MTQQNLSNHLFELGSSAAGRMKMKRNNNHQGAPTPKKAKAPTRLSAPTRSMLMHMARGLAAEDFIKERR